MKIIAITPRIHVTEHQERFEAVAQQWGSWLAHAGALMMPLSYSIWEAQLARCPADAVILSGGNDIASLENAKNTAPERDKAETQIIDWATKQKLPILGVCRGMQFLNLYFGGKLTRVQGHAGTRHVVKFLSGDEEEVNSYHEWGIAPSGLPHSMQAIATDKAGNIEAMQHAILPVLGVMWHPERESASSKVADALVKDFLKKAL